MHTDMTTLTYIDSKNQNAKDLEKLHRRVVGLTTVPRDDFSEAGPYERVVQDYMSRTTLVVCRTVHTTLDTQESFGKHTCAKIFMFLAPKC